MFGADNETEKIADLPGFLGGGKLREERLEVLKSLDDLSRRGT
jgi:hypothetical protein